MSKPIRERHGIENARKVVGVESSLEQTVTVIDDDGQVLLALSSVWPAGLTPEQAEMLADQLKRAAVRVRGSAEPKSPAQVAGGHARAAALTPERRKEIAKQAADTRWGSE